MKYFFGFTDAKDPDVKPCCDIDVTGIFVANHQKAVKSGEDAAKAKKVDNLTITNSALSEDGTKLASAGEHIVCAVFDAVKDDDAENTESRKVAFGILKEYAKQFSGEDLDEKKVYSLQDEGQHPSAPAAKEEASADDKKSSGSETDGYQKILDDASSQVNESSSSSSDDDSSSVDPDSFSSPESGESSSASSSSGDDSSNSSAQQKVGYYFVYKLVIEGIKESSFGSALKKMASKMIDGFDMKVKFTSLFGGGGDEIELSGKKMRQYLQAKIDPAKLENAFYETIQKKFPSEKYGGVTIKIYDKNVIVKFLGHLVGAQDKKKILDADYSLVVKVKSSSKVRDLLKPAMIVKLLRESIREVQPNMKLFKNRIKEKDVIIVSNSKASEIAAANDERQGTDNQGGNSVLEESYNSLKRSSTRLKLTSCESFNSQQTIFDLLFEAEGEKVTISFKYPEKWASPTEGTPKDFDNKKQITVDKNTTYGQIKQTSEVVSAEKQAQEKFDEYAYWVGWVADAKDRDTIKDNYSFSKNTVLLAKYKRREKNDDEDDLKSSGQSFDYYVIPMPGLKYPDKDDER